MVSPMRFTPRINKHLLGNVNINSASHSKLLLNYCTFTDKFYEFHEGLIFETYTSMK